MRSPKWLLLAALAFACVASAAGPVPTYQTRTLEGWTVRIDARLLAAANKPATEAWLLQHGRNPAMVKSIEFTNVAIFEKESKRMPELVLHELSHAYHHRVLGYEHAGLMAAYARAMASKRYDCVERWNGPGLPNTFGPAYAVNNVQEYFAENSEALFARSDFHPFTREELGKHDPSMLALLQQVWQVSMTTTPTAPTTPTPPPVSSHFDARCHYRLTTLWQGEGMSLDILHDGKANNVPVLARTGDYTGQKWKLTPEANGFYRLTTQAQGDALSLDILSDGRANNIPILAKTGNVSGQLWKMTPVSPF